MTERLRLVLVKSFVGTIAVGWIFAQGTLHLAYVFSAPIAGWLQRREYHGLVDHSAIPTGFSLRDALPELGRSLSLLLLGYLLLRWLFYKSLGPGSLDSGPQQSSDPAR
jgi:hypothetical protein